MKTRFLSISDTNIVESFCEECKKLGYSNNSSLQNMKWYWKDVKWVGTFKYQNIISLSGIHPFLEMGENAFRIMFRGASLPGYSSTFLNFKQVPLKIQYALLISENPTFYVTFNISKNVGAKSYRMSKAIGRRNDFTFVKKMNYFNTMQEIWKYENNLIY
tara:strand:- start:337 stop:816 length:480 start_codon:yes stop_codon:yes gene_type:complete